MNVLKITYYAIEFLLFYLIKLVQSNIVIAYDILSPKMHVNPSIIKVPLIINSNVGLLLFSNLLSMTPGTLSLDISDDKKFMWVHVLYKKSEDEMLVEIQEIQGKISRITK